MLVAQVRKIRAVKLAFAGIVLTQREAQGTQRVDFLARQYRRLAVANLVHELRDVLQLLDYRPFTVRGTPLRARLEPDGEGFRKILSRMRLRVRWLQMQDVVPTVWLGIVMVGIRRGVLAKQLGILLAPMQAIGGIERVPRFVAQNPQAPVLCSTLHLQ